MKKAICIFLVFCVVLVLFNYVFNDNKDMTFTESTEKFVAVLEPISHQGENIIKIIREPGASALSLFANWLDVPEHLSIWEKIGNFFGGIFGK